jgi:hypothetical protein
VAQVGRLAVSCVEVEGLQAEPGRRSLVLLICFEAFSGGLLTTVTFTYMMGPHPAFSLQALTEK